MNRPAPMITRLAHGTVGRFSSTVSMGVVEIGSTEQAIVQFLDAPRATNLVLGRPVHQGDVTVTMLESHPRADLRTSYVIVESVFDETVFDETVDADTKEATS